LNWPIVLGCHRSEKVDSFSARLIGFICASRDEVERVRELVGALGEPAVEIAHLITDVDSRSVRRARPSRSSERSVARARYSSNVGIEVTRGRR
jgi:hypothetical protein